MNFESFLNIFNRVTSIENSEYGVIFDTGKVLVVFTEHLFIIELISLVSLHSVGRGISEKFRTSNFSFPSPLVSFSSLIVSSHILFNCTN